MPTARALIARASEELARAGVPTPQVDAELLLAHVTDRPRLTLGLMGEVPPEQERAFTELVARRAAREPLQHLTGAAPFRHLELAVGPGVFVPRPETELMVDEALAHLARGRVAGSPEGPVIDRPAIAGPDIDRPAIAGPDIDRPEVRASSTAPAPEAPGSGPVLVDLCTGSAAIALSLAAEIPGSRVHAVELSGAAVAWARRNVDACAEDVRAAGSELQLHSADATTAAEPGGVLHDLVGNVDVVVTNPPYVPDAAVPREPEVRDHDPHLALFGGPDGLDVIRPLARQAALLLRPGGLLLVEHADAQGEDAGPLGVPALLRAMAEPADPDPAAGRAVPPALSEPPDPSAARPGALDPGTPRPAWCDVADHPDLAGRPRFTSAIRCGQDRTR